MKKIMVAALAMGVTGFLGFSGTVYADNITIWDGTGAEISGQGGEDQETEPGMINNQSWDLEGFFLDGTKLSIVGGYDFLGGNGNTEFGDIFIDTDGHFGSSQGPDSVNNGNIPSLVDSTFGYEYVFDLDLINKKYVLWDLTDDLNSLTPDPQTYDVYVAQNGNNTPIGSNPWRWASGGVEIASGSFDSYGYDVTSSGFEGLTHYSLTGFDLSPIIGAEGGGPLDFTSHATMSCGNDNLMGKGTTPVPEPGMLLLVGTAFAGLVNVRRKRIKRA